MKIKLNSAEASLVKELLEEKLVTTEYARKWANDDLRGESRRAKLKELDAEESLVRDLLEEFKK
jgi:hypothetical protein